MPKKTKEIIVQLRNRYTECLNDPRNEVYLVALGKVFNRTELTSHESSVYNSYEPILSSLEEERCKLASMLVNVPLKQLVPEISVVDFEWIMDNVSKINVWIEAPYEMLGSVIRCKMSDLESIIEETFGGGSYIVEIIDCTLEPLGLGVFRSPDAPSHTNLGQSPVIIEGIGKEGTFMDTLLEWGIIETL